MLLLEPLPSPNPSHKLQDRNIKGIHHSQHLSSSYLTIFRSNVTLAWQLGSVGIIGLGWLRRGLDGVGNFVWK